MELLLDLVLSIFAVSVLISGWHRGLIVSVISLCGVASGLAVARAIITTVQLPTGDNTVSEFVWIVGVLFGTVIIGSAFGANIGRAIRDGVNVKSLIALDAFGGSLFSVASWSIVVWFMAATIAVAPINGVAYLIGQSRVLNTLDTEMPNTVRSGVNRLQIYVAVNKLPELKTDLQVLDELPEPSIEITKDPDVKEALSSVVRVEGVSSKCKVSTSGSGFTVGEKLIMTNAHVVAGTNHVGVRVKGKGRQLEGRVVYFDANIDVAIVYVPKLNTAALALDEKVSANESTVVAGFPGGGGLDTIAATVSRGIRSRGTDIYGEKTISRNIYTIKADIKHGDSGAALITNRGEVAGMVFAASATDSNIGYVLAPSEFAEAIKQASDNKEAVGTGKCMPN